MLSVADSTSGLIDDYHLDGLEKSWIKDQVYTNCTFSVIHSKTTITKTCKVVYFLLPLCFSGAQC